MGGPSQYSASEREAVSNMDLKRQRRIVRSCERTVERSKIRLAQAIANLDHEQNLLRLVEASALATGEKSSS